MPSGEEHAKCCWKAAMCACRAPDTPVECADMSCDLLELCDVSNWRSPLRCDGAWCMDILRMVYHPAEGSDSRVA